MTKPLNPGLAAAHAKREAKRAEENALSNARLDVSEAIALRFLALGFTVLPGYMPTGNMRLTNEQAEAIVTKLEGMEQ